MQLVCEVCTWPAKQTSAQKKNSHELFQNLVKQLGQEGWEPTGDFDPHAIASFRRRVK
jgi:hypothetical protein